MRHKQVFNIYFSYLCVGIRSVSSIIQINIRITNLDNCNSEVKNSKNDNNNHNNNSKFKKKKLIARLGKI